MSSGERQAREARARVRGRRRRRGVRSNRCRIGTMLSAGFFLSFFRAVVLSPSLLGSRRCNRQCGMSGSAHFEGSGPGLGRASQVTKLSGRGRLAGFHGSGRHYCRSGKWKAIRLVFPNRIRNKSRSDSKWRRRRRREVKCGEVK